MAKRYEKNNITLPGAVAMRSGVMIGAGIFAPTGEPAAPPHQGGKGLRMRSSAMRTEMKKIPRSQYRTPGTTGDRTPVATVVVAGFLAVFFDHGRIASHRVLQTAIVLDTVVPAAFAAIRRQSDPLIVGPGAIRMALVFLFARIFPGRNPVRDGDHEKQ